MNARRKLLLAAQRAEARSDDPTRHKCFVSYHADDADEIVDFIDYFGHVFIPRVIGVSDEDDFIDSDDGDYVMRRIRDKYLRDSTVTSSWSASARGPGATSTGRSTHRCATRPAGRATG